MAGGRPTGSFAMIVLFVLIDAKWCAQAARKHDRHTDSSRTAKNSRWMNLSRDMESSRVGEDFDRCLCTVYKSNVPIFLSVCEGARPFAGSIRSVVAAGRKQSKPPRQKKGVSYRPYPMLSPIP